MTSLPPLPAVQADERTTLEQFLDYFRGVFARKADGLDDTQARERVGASALDMIGLVRHMAGVERWWFAQALDGADVPELWTNPDDPDDPDADFHHHPADTIDEARQVLRAEVGHSRNRVAAHTSLDDLTAIELGPPDDPERFGRRSLRWIMVHMIEEYARHCGHADLIREAIDGSVDD